MTKSIFISAGDISGDFHVANLVKSIKIIDQGIRITSLGGENLKKVSDVFLCNICDLGAFGFFAPFRYFLFFWKLFAKIKGEWKKNKPDKVVLVDFYGFNIHIAKYASKNNIPVYYFICPQIWASRKGRIKKLRKYVTKLLVILPFEEIFYKNEGINAIFIGHPLIDVIGINNVKDKNNEIPLIGLFPGSRKMVYARHMPILEKTSELISDKIEANFKIFVSNPSSFYYKSKYPIVKSDDFNERSKLTFAITTSGTVSLENALLGVPMVVFYKVSLFNYFLAKLLIKIKYITLANILLGKELIPELLQKNANPQIIAEKVISIINDKERIKKMRDELLGLRKMLGEPGVSNRATKIILEE